VENISEAHAKPDKDNGTMKIFIPTPLRAYTGKQDTVEVRGATVQDVLSGLTTQYPDLRKHLFTEDGKLRSFVNLYLNDEDIRYLDEKDQTAVSETDSLSIIPSIAGGCPPHGRTRFAVLAVRADALRAKP
jgi:molybdopterin converting factor small subunit